MAQGRAMSKVEPEVTQALQSVRLGKDFLIKGGAGSGKTHSMLGLLKEVYAKNPQARVVCITFTNVAVNEIRARFPTSHLEVSTIHGFLWTLIGRYQKNLRQSLTDLINSGEIKSTLSLPIDATFWEGKIAYKEWLNLGLGEISHVEVLKLAKHMFREHATLSRILSDSYDYLLVDEYQDTPADVLQILLEELPDPETRALRIGLFGDIGQAIHEENKGKEIIDRAVDTGRVRAIEKTHNRRNPAAVIPIINRLRADNLKQVQSDDPTAPNYQVQGTARFVYTTSSVLNTESLRELDFSKDWSFASEDTKLLYLGKTMIAKENRFPRLMEIYDKDRVVEYAKRINDKLKARGEAVPAPWTFGEVLKVYGEQISPTPTQRAAFEADPTLTVFASNYLFEDLITTSTNSDRLLGTKKMSVFDNRDHGEKRDALINHLLAIQTLLDLYQKGKFNQVIRSIDVELDNIEKRETVATNLQRLSTMQLSSVGELLTFAERSNLLRRSDTLRRFEDRNAYRCARVSAVSFDEVVNLFKYLEDHSPFSTQHGVKGSEWDNIFVSLDNGGWNLYNFEKLLDNPGSTDSVVSRSRMMLYVTCSRAKKNLVVYAHEPSDKTLERAKEWFGEGNVVCVDGFH